MRNLRRRLILHAIVLGTPMLIAWSAVSLIAWGVRIGRGGGRYSDTSGMWTAQRALEHAMWGWGPPLVIVLLLVGYAFAEAIASAPRGLAPRKSRLRTARLELRRARRGDLDALHAILSDPVATAHWDEATFSPEQSATFLQRLRGRQRTRDVFVIVHEGALIGIVGSMELPWITYMLAPSHWGQGFASEALNAFAAYVFARGEPSLHVATDVANARSLALLRRLGFIEKGRSMGLYHVHGRPVEAVHLGLTAECFAERRAQSADQRDTGKQGLTRAQAPLASAREA